MKDRSLITQLRITFLWIVMASIVSTLFTYFLAIIIFERGLQNESIRPENYYEKKLPRIERYIQKEKDIILSDSKEIELKNIIQEEEIAYQVIDVNGNILYGNYQKEVVKTKEQFFSVVNTTIWNSPDYIRVVPVFNQREMIKGAVLLIYPLSLSLANQKQDWLNGMITVVILSPLIYMVGFTFLFSRKFIRKITEPLKLLIDGVNQIKKRDLDFDLDIPSYSKNELGKLCVAFTEMKEELKSSLSKQWKMEQERLELVAALAHDLKSPLSVIKVYAEALEDDTELQKEQKEYLEVIDQNIEKSILIVQQMQYSSELESEMIQLNFVKVDFMGFLERKMAEYEIQAKKKEIAVCLEKDEAIPLYLSIDVEKVERILDNLFSNSLQYTKKGGQITLLVQEKNQNLYYTIQDSGTGFQEEDLRKVFDRFYRGDKARSTKEAHSGLGLYIVKQLVEHMGGEVEIRNREEGGAWVQFWHEYTSFESKRETTNHR